MSARVPDVSSRFLGPTVSVWRASGDDHAWQHLSICPSDRRNDVLVFDEHSGRHRATLNEARTRVRVRAGSVALASMHAF